MKKRIVLSFFIPIFIFYIMLLFAGIYPLGEKSILISDLSNMYVDLLSGYKEILSGKHNFGYSWNLGMGGNTFSTIFFYLSSPLNFLLFIPYLNIQDILLIITILKIGLCGLTSNFYFSKKFKFRISESLVFSTCYALMAYNICYIQHLMWFDGVILLPLVIYFLDEFLEKNKKNGLIVILIIAFYSNFYTAYMIGLFSIIYFWYVFFNNDTEITLRVTIIKFVKFGYYSMISFMICGIFLIPTYLSISKRNSIDEFFKIGFKYKFGDITSKLFIGNFDTWVPGGIPNLYCTLLVLILVLYYFFNRKISINKKISTFIVFIIMYLSIQVPLLYAIWHGFDNPDWFEGRFSFVISFFLITVACESHKKIENKFFRKNIYEIMLVIVTLLLSSVILKEYMKSNLFINLLFLSLYFIIFKLKYRNSNKMLLVLVLCELLTNSILINSAIRNKQENYENRNLYIINRKNLINTVEKIKEKDDSFYRLEKDFRRRENESMLADYKGITIFDSNYNREIHKLLFNLGMPFYDKVGNFEGTTLFSESLLGVKYILSRDINKVSLYSEPIMTIDDIFVFRNNQALPLLTVVNSDILNIDNKKDYENPFEYQNKIIKKMTGGNLQIFKNINVDIEIENLEVVSENNKTIKYRKSNLTKEAFLKFKVNSAERINYMYIKKFNQELSLIKINNFNNPNELAGYNDKIFKINNGDTVEIDLKGDEIEVDKKIFYSFNKKNYEDMMDKIDKPNLIYKFNDTNVEAKLNNEKRESLLMTSIPYEKGWSVFIDGEKRKIERVLGAFIGVKLKPKDSEVKIKYEVPGLKLGIIMSLSGLILLFILNIYKKILDRILETGKR